MIVHAVSDLHGHLPNIPPGDLLLIAGDITPLNREVPDLAYHWLNDEFRIWLTAQRRIHHAVVAVLGNHDFFGQHRGMTPKLPWIVLQDSELTLTIRGQIVRIYGAPWTASQGWAFSLPEDLLAVKWRQIPDRLDILLLHGPPNRILDELEFPFRVIGDPTPTEHLGSLSLRQRIEVVQPKVTVFGHVHYAHGHREMAGLRFYNVAICDEKYRPTNPVTTFEL